MLWRKWKEDGSLEQVAEDLGFPVVPFVVIHGNMRNHMLEGFVSSLLVDPLNSLGREDGEAR